MDERLRQNIGEVCGCEHYEAITGIMWQNGTPWQLFSFDNDIDFEGERWRVVMVQKWVYDPDDVTAVDYTEDIFSEAWQL